MYKPRKCQQLQRPNGTKIFLKLQQNYTAAISRDFLVLCSMLFNFQKFKNCNAATEWPWPHSAT